MQIVGRSSGQIMVDSVDREEGERQLQVGCYQNGRTINYQEEYKEYKGRERERALCVVHA